MDIEQERIYAFWLVRESGAGPSAVGKMLADRESFEEIFRLDAQELSEVYGFPEEKIHHFLERKKQLERCGEEYGQMKETGTRMILITEEGYPERLKNIFDPPAVLFYRGTLPAENCPSAAVIGARKCTPYGKEEAACFGRLLAENGIQVISGMAGGIDAEGHRGVLTAGGKAFAVLGNGPEICYPRSSIDIYRKIPDTGGGILSEYGPGEMPEAWHFPRRNRIISGLSDAVIVIEARKRSGSLITADLALEQGKDVFALPGRRSDPLSEGCNRLIRVGAGIITDTEDILDYFHISRRAQEKKDYKKKPILVKNEKMLYSVLDSSPKHPEILSELSGLPFWETLEALISLEEKGLAVSSSNQYYMRKPL